MQHLDEDHLQTDGSQFTLVGGKASNHSRKPSYLLERRKSLPLGVLKNGCSGGSAKPSPSNSLVHSLSRASSQSIGEIDGFMDDTVLRWNAQDVEDWLREADLNVYQVG